MGRICMNCIRYKMDLHKRRCILVYLFSIVSLFLQFFLQNLCDNQTCRTISYVYHQQQLAGCFLVSNDSGTGTVGRQVALRQADREIERQTDRQLLSTYIYGMAGGCEQYQKSDYKNEMVLVVDSITQYVILARFIESLCLVGKKLSMKMSCKYCPNLVHVYQMNGQNIRLILLFRRDASTE